MRVTDVMQTSVRTIRGTQSVGEAISLLAESHVSGLPVIDEHGRLVGVISSSDVLEKLAESQEPEIREVVFEQTQIMEVMTPRPQTIHPDATVRDAAQRMLYLEVHRLSWNRKVGWSARASTTDLVRALAGSRV